MLLLNNRQEIEKEKSMTNKPMIALSFDDGPNLEITPLVLDILEEYRIPASFFVIGNTSIFQTAVYCGK